MRIIRNIEIGYFRSAYRIRLARLRDINVLSGRNDVGKSNVMKALNLFFNGQTDWQTDLDFYRDFSSQRLVEVRQESIKGKQFIRVTVEFQRPDSYKNSLPEFFRVSRKWHRNSIMTEENNLESLERQRKLPNTLKTAKRFLPIFYNRVHFEYVPAVKDRVYFKHLLARLQTTLLDMPTGQDTDLSQVTHNVAQHIQGKIVELQDDFQRATNIHSVVTPPAELGSLFQAFAVSTISGDEHKIPLSLRGDGVQARYVPSVLRYICGKSNDFFIWGFEEPENSLEYSHVVSLAKDLQKTYTKVAQIFLTTHSPAFTAFRSNDAACFRVFLNTSGLSEVGSIWPEAGTSEEKAELNKEMGFLRIQEDLHKEYVEQSEKFKALQIELETLKEEARQIQKPVILLEGKHDKPILETAWKKCYPNTACPFIFRPVDPAGEASPGGSGGSDTLRKAIETIHPDMNQKTVAIFDRDREGIKAFGSLSRNFTKWKNRGDVKKHANGIAFATLLTIPPGRENYAQSENLTMEFMFPDEILNLRTPDDRGLDFETPKPILIVGNKRVPIEPGQITFQIDAYRKIVDGKDVFANHIVPGLDTAHFEVFMPLFETLQEILR